MLREGYYPLDPQEILESSELKRHETVLSDIQSKISDIQSEISELRSGFPELQSSEVCELEATIVVLEREKKHAEKNIVWIRSILSPIRKLSQDILREIFSYAGLEPIYISDHSRPRGAPLEYRYVCAQWRGVVDGTKSLWSGLRIETEIFFRLKAGHTPLQGQIQARIQARALRFLVWVLDKSGYYPLNITFGTVYPYYRISTDTPLNDIGVSCLLSISHRLKCLTINHWHKDNPYLECMRDNLRHLKKLNLSIPQNYGQSETSYTIFMNNPALTHLTLDVARFDQDVLGLPYERVETLIIRANNMSQCGRILSQCHSLKHLHAYFLETTHDRVHPVSMPQLRSLSLATTSTRTSCCFLRSVTAASLDEFTIHRLSDFSDRELAALQQMQTRSQYTLSFLTLQVGCDELVRFPEVFRLFLSLKTLTLIGKRFEQPLLNALTLPSHTLLLQLSERQNILLPNLGSIIIEAEEDIDQDALLGMIRSRFEPANGFVQVRFNDDGEPLRVASLQDVRLRFKFEINATVLEQLHSMQSMGLKLFLNETMNGFRLHRF